MFLCINKAKDDLTITEMSRQRERRFSKLHPYLVGYTGKVYRDHRLYPLKMNGKYKNALTKEKHDRDTKVFTILVLVFLLALLKPLGFH